MAAAPVETAAEVAAETVAASETVRASSSAAPAHKPTGQADRSLMKRSTYSGVVDTGPVAGETFAQKVERLAKFLLPQNNALMAGDCDQSCKPNPRGPSGRREQLSMTRLRRLPLPPAHAQRLASDLQRKETQCNLRLPHHKPWRRVPISQGLATSDSICGVVTPGASFLRLG